MWLSPTLQNNSMGVVSYISLALYWNKSFYRILYELFYHQFSTWIGYCRVRYLHRFQHCCYSIPAKWTAATGCKFVLDISALIILIISRFSPGLIHFSNFRHAPNDSFLPFPIAIRNRHGERNIPSHKIAITSFRC